jgi:hypothetical protein
MSDIADPYFIEDYETLPELLERVSGRYGVNPKDLLGTGKKIKAVNDARGDFCYQAYLSGRYSLKYLAMFCKSTKKNMYWRIRSHAARKGLPYPFRGVECVVGDATRKYVPGDVATLGQLPDPRLHDPS